MGGRIEVKRLHRGASRGHGLRCCAHKLILRDESGLQEEGCSTACSHHIRKSSSSSGGFNHTCAAVVRLRGRTSTLKPRPSMAAKACSSVVSSPRYAAGVLNFISLRMVRTASPLSARSEEHTSE